MGKRTDYPILKSGDPMIALVGERLKADLNERGISYAELERLSGVDAQLIGRICREPATTPDLRALAAISKALRRPVDWYVWKQRPEMAVVYDFLAYNWEDLLAGEKEFVLNVMRHMDNLVHERRTIEQYSKERIRDSK